MSFVKHAIRRERHFRGGISRRGFLARVGAVAAGSLLVPSQEAFSKALSKERRLTLINMNTDEELGIVCCPQKNYDRKTLAQFSHFLRDHRTDEAHAMDPALIDLLYAVTVLTRGNGEYRIISGYRAPETNHMLRKASHSVAEHSLHMIGKAIDMRTDDVSTKTLQTAAIALQQGGVGYYPAADFVHMDTGDIRTW